MENKTPEQYIKDYFGEIIDGCNKRGERISQYDVCKVIEYAMEEYGKQQYNQGVLDAAENAEVCFTEDCVIVRGDAEVDKDTILKLIKQ